MNIYTHSYVNTYVYTQSGLPGNTTIFFGLANLVVIFFRLHRFFCFVYSGVRRNPNISHIFRRTSKSYHYRF